MNGATPYAGITTLTFLGESTMGVGVRATGSRHSDPKSSYLRRDGSIRQDGAGDSGGSLTLRRTLV